MQCWKCEKPTEFDVRDKIPFRAECEHCGSALHCCRNCRYYKPGLPNDCMVPGTDFIRDREAPNLCEEYRPLEKLTIKPDPRDRKKLFDSLFKDEN